MLLEAVAAFINVAASWSAVLLQHWLVGFTHPTKRYTEWYKGGGENLRQKCQNRSAPNPLEGDRWEEHPDQAY